MFKNVHLITGNVYWKAKLPSFEFICNVFWIYEVKCRDNVSQQSVRKINSITMF